MNAIADTMKNNPFAVFAVAALLVGFAIATVFEPLAGVAVAATPILLFWIARDRNNLLLLFLFVLPFSNAMFIGENIGGIQGAKVPNILAALVVLSMIFDGDLFASRDRMERAAMQVFGLYILLFLIAVLRSIPNYKLFHTVEPTLFPDEFWSYVLSYVVKPFTMVVPFFVLLKRARSAADIEHALHDLTGMAYGSVVLFMKRSLPEETTVAGK